MIQAIQASRFRLINRKVLRIILLLITAGFSYAVGFLFAILTITFKGPHKEDRLQDIVLHDSNSVRSKLLKCKLLGLLRKIPDMSSQDSDNVFTSFVSL